MMNPKNLYSKFKKSSLFAKGQSFYSDLKGMQSIFVKILFGIGLVPAGFAAVVALFLFAVCFGIHSVLKVIADLIFPIYKREFWVFRFILKVLGWMLMASVLFSGMGFVLSGLFFGAPFLIGAFFLSKALKKRKKQAPKESDLEEAEVVTIDV